MSAAGRVADIVPPAAIRTAAYHRPGVALRIVEDHVSCATSSEDARVFPRGTRCRVVVPATAEERASVNALRFGLRVASLGPTETPSLRRTSDEVCVVGRLPPATRYARLLTPLPVGTLLAPIEAPHCPCFRLLGRDWTAPVRDELVWVELESGEREICHTRAVWRSAVTPSDIFGCLLRDALPSGCCAHLPSTGQLVWSGGQQMPGGGLLPHAPAFLFTISRRFTFHTLSREQPNSVAHAVGPWGGASSDY